MNQITCSLGKTRNVERSTSSTIDLYHKIFLPCEDFFEALLTEIGRASCRERV